MNDRDCESCKKFSRNDPHESEGYCDAKRTWVDPQEGEDCKMHEFTLHSATKYKDGTPIMSEPKDVSNQLDSDYCKFGTCPYYDKLCDHTLQDKHRCVYLSHTPEANLKYLEQAFTEFAKTQDATLKTHGDTLEQHTERITINEDNIDAISSDIEDLQKKIYAIYQFLGNCKRIYQFLGNCKRTCELEHYSHWISVKDILPRALENVIVCTDINTVAVAWINGDHWTFADTGNGHTEDWTFDDVKYWMPLPKPPKAGHNGSNFCGNCTHAEMEDGICACNLSGEVVDPDDSSCAMFEPPF